MQLSSEAKGPEGPSEFNFIFTLMGVIWSLHTVKI